MVRAPARRSGTLVVAEDDVNVVGFAGALDHGACVALSDLFVRPDRQSQGIGRALLDAVRSGRPAGGDDGLGRPAQRWPPTPVAACAHVGPPTTWAWTPTSYATPRGPTLDVAPCSPRSTPGSSRATTRTTRRSVADAFGHRRAGEPLGTALTVAGSPQRLAHPDTTRSSSRPSMIPDDGGAVVLAVVALPARRRSEARRLCRYQGRTARWHPCSSGASRITDADMACATHEDLLADPSRHTMHGEARVALA